MAICIREGARLVATADSDYELVDFGNGEKLERYGTVLVRRPDPHACGPWRLPAQGGGAQAVYVGAAGRGYWRATSVPPRWECAYGGLRFWVRLTPYKHTGLFAEQRPVWDWLRCTLRPGDQVLNLFAYTGGATMACAQAGARVVHVDAAASTLRWARDNAELNHLAGAPIRWITDDALEFVARERRRGRRYQVVLLDPPATGKAAGRRWRLADDLDALLRSVADVLAPDAKAVHISGYAGGIASAEYGEVLAAALNARGGLIEHGPLCIATGDAHAVLAAGCWARWRPAAA